MTAQMSIVLDRDFADKYAKAKAAFDAAEAELENLKRTVIAVGQECIVGITCDLVLTLVEQNRIDNAKLKAFLTDAQIESCKVKSLQNRITVKEKGL